MTYPDSIPACEVARLMSQFGIPRAERDGLAASRYRLVQVGTEIYPEQLFQDEAPEPKLSGWKNRGKETAD